MKSYCLRFHFSINFLKGGAYFHTVKICGSWHENTVMGILRNEKYTGNLLLQKTFIVDHISKKSNAKTKVNCQCTM